MVLTDQDDGKRNQNKEMNPIEERQKGFSDRKRNDALFFHVDHQKWSDVNDGSVLKKIPNQQIHD